MPTNKARQVVYLHNGVMKGFVQREGAEIIMADAIKAGYQVQKYFDFYYGRPGFNVLLAPKRYVQ